MNIVDRPIRPDEVVTQKSFPPFVYHAFNSLIAKKWNNGRAVVDQEDVVQLILDHAPEDTNRQSVFDEHWLDIEDVYREAGFKVEYDKPAYNENYPATFTFSKKR